MLLALQDLDARARRHVEMIHRGAVRMETLIEDLLDSTNIRAGRLVIDQARIGGVGGPRGDRSAAASREERGLKLVRESHVEGVDIHCDRDRILQVLGNLIGNAIKFCRPGDPITVKTERDGENVRFCVADTGPGIPPDRLPFLFDAYWSGSEHTKQGSGLGLYISRGIIESHGGRLWVDSAPGEGARFFFTLPVAE